MKPSKTTGRNPAMNTTELKSIVLFPIPEHPPPFYDQNRGLAVNHHIPMTAYRCVR
jgi:hypothetical protein